MTGSVSVLPPAAPPPTYAGGTLTWEGTVVSGGSVTVSFQVRVAPGVVGGTVITNLAWLQDRDRVGAVYTDSVTNTVGIAPG